MIHNPFIPDFAFPDCPINCFSYEELSIASRKMNFTLELIDTIGKDFVVPAENKIQKSDETKAESYEDTKTKTPVEKV